MELGLDNLDNLTGIFNFATDKSSIVRISLVICTFTCYVILFNFFANLLKAFLIHEEVPKINQKRATNALWHVIFFLVVLFYTINFYTFLDGSTSFKETLKQAALKPDCNNSAIQNIEDNFTENFVTMVLPITFCLHQLFVSTSLHLEPDVLSTVSSCLFIYALHTIRCPNLCTKLFSLIAVDVGSMELARAVYALKSRRKGCKGSKAPLFLRITAVPSFLLHVLAWSVINLYIVPIIFLSLPAVSEVDPSHRMATAYINIFLVLWAKQRLFESPVWYLCKMLVTRPADFKKMRSFNTIPTVLLLPYTSQLLPELKAIQMDSFLNTVPSSAERRLMRKKILAANGQSSAPITEEKADLLSIIKCVKVLKRKMRYRYEQKNGSDAGETGNNHDTNAPEDHVSSANDITDIYIPVPQTTQQDIATSSSADSNLIPSTEELESKNDQEEEED